MKKLMNIVFSGIAIIAFNGCGGGGGDDGPVPETYFITDGFGNGVSGIIYRIYI